MEMNDRLDRIEAMLVTLLQQQAVRDWYSTREIAEALGKSDFTVREWCRQGRIHAEKKGSGRGKYRSWVVSHGELQRIRREGLLPLPRA
jgi:excisionase family DNA binding protein